MTHPLDMSLSVTGWAIDPDLISDIRFELIHSDMTGDCFRIKLAFRNQTEALIELELKDQTGEKVYNDLTDALRVPRMAPVISGDDDVKP